MECLWKCLYYIWAYAYIRISSKYLNRERTLKGVSPSIADMSGIHQIQHRMSLRHDYVCLRWVFLSHLRITVHRITAQQNILPFLRTMAIMQSA